MCRNRLIAAMFATSLVTALASVVGTSTAVADPYRWCAIYSGGRGGGAQNCGFVTYAQCMATVSGIGGFCNQNPFYDGRPFNDGSRRYRRRY